MSALVCDLIFSSWIFLTVLAVSSVIAAVIYNIDVGKNPHNFGFLSGLLGGGIVSAIIVIIGMMTLISTGLLYFSVPLANLFWACAAPSAWLWLYLLAFLFTRFLLRVSPLIKRVLGFLDVEQKPMECVGLVAGGLVLVSSLVVNSIYATLRM